MNNEKDEKKLKELVACIPELVHASNLLNKIQSEQTNERLAELSQILPRYLDYFNNCEDARSSQERIPLIVHELNEYYNFVKATSHYRPQAKLQSSILEEFFFLLFKDLVSNLNQDGKKTISSGSADAYTNLYFIPDSHVTNDGKVVDKEFYIGAHKKNQDYAIFRSIPMSDIFKMTVNSDRKGDTLNLPIVAIECKTYLDKTMLDGAIAVAEKLKSGNPQSLYIVVAEEYDISGDIDPSYSRIDQIYILRKRKKRKNAGYSPFAPDVVSRLFDRVQKHLTRGRETIIEKIEKKGFVI